MDPRPRGALVCVALLLAAVASAAHARLRGIQAVEVQQLPDRVRITIKGDGPLTVRHRTFTNIGGVPYCIAVDVDGQLSGIGRGLTRVRTAGVWAVRYGNFTNSVVRVSVAARRPVPYQVERGDDPSTVNVDIPKPADDAQTGEDGSSKRTAPTVLPLPPAQHAEATVAAVHTSPAALSMPPQGEAEPAVYRGDTGQRASVTVATAAEPRATAPTSSAPDPRSTPAPTRPKASPAPVLSAPQPSRANPSGYVNDDGTPASTKISTVGEALERLPKPKAATPPTPLLGLTGAERTMPAEPGGTQPSEPVSQSAGKPGRLSIEGVDTDIGVLLRALASQAKVNIVVAPELQGTVTISLKDVTLTQALDAIAAVAKLAYKEVNGTYYVAAPDRIKELFPEPTVTDTYTATKAAAADLQQRLQASFRDLTVSIVPPSTILMSGPREKVAAAKAVLSSMDVALATTEQAGPKPTEEYTDVYELSYLDATAAKAFVKEMYPDVDVTSAPSAMAPPMAAVGGGGTGGGGTSSMGVGAISMQTAPPLPSMILVLRGPKAMVEGAVSTIKRLDVPPRQVEIHARVLDMNTTLDGQLGFTWTWKPFDIVEGSASGNTVTGEARTGRDALHFGTFSRSPVELNMVLDALVKQGHGRVLAEPSIRVLNGGTGQIFIGDTVTYLVSRDVTPTGTSVNTSQIQAGVTLNVAARIAKDGSVMLGVNTAVSVLTSLTGLPSTSERSAQTSVRVKDGETIAIGGLLRDEDVSTLSKIPGLGDLPFFGNLFRSRSKSKQHSEVVIFLTTRVMPN